MTTLVIDSSCLAYQAHYALPKLSYDGIETDVIYGFLNRILDMGLVFKTNDIVFCWEGRGSLRKELFPGYKDKRYTEDQLKHKAMLFQQMDRLRKDILPRMGWKNHLKQDGYESDDMMAALVQGPGDFVIVTADEDLHQCINNSVRVFNPSRHKMLHPGNFKRVHGVEIAQWVTVKILAGCKSDKVPGVGGVGELTVRKYFRGQLKETTKAYKNITENTDIITRNTKLITLPFSGAEVPKLQPNQFSKEAFIEVCEDFGLHSFMEGDRLNDWSRLFRGQYKEPPKMVFRDRKKRKKKHVKR